MGNRVVFLFVSFGIRFDLIYYCYFFFNVFVSLGFTSYKKKHNFFHFISLPNNNLQDERYDLLTMNSCAQSTCSNDAYFWRPSNKFDEKRNKDRMNRFISGIPFAGCKIANCTQSIDIGVDFARLQGS